MLGRFIEVHLYSIGVDVATSIVIPILIGSIYYIIARGGGDFGFSIPTIFLNVKKVECMMKVFRDDNINGHDEVVSRNYDCHFYLFSFTERWRGGLAMT